MSKKYVYLFSEGNANMRELLGGKGANLAEMTNIGLPVPQGFTITTEACTQYYEDGRQINDEIMAEIMQYVAKMEEMNGKKFGDLQNPMLVSVRSGARASMPGMMDTILNLGLNDDVVAAMIKGNPDPKFERFVYDSYRRFIQMFSDVVMEVGKKYFEQLIDKMKAEKGVTSDLELDASDLKKLAEQFVTVNNLAIEGSPNDLVINTHVCRGNYHSVYFASGAYDPIADPLFTRENVNAYYLEFDDERSGGFSCLKDVTPGKKVVLGLITTKRPELEDKAAIIARIHEAAKYVPLENLYLSPQCGFASCEIGNKLTEEQQWAKLALVKEIAEEVWD